MIKSDYCLLKSLWGSEFPGSITDLLVQEQVRARSNKDRHFNETSNSLLLKENGIGALQGVLFTDCRSAKKRK